MILKRFYDEPLAQASYLVGCQSTGEALIVDPLRDVTPYIEAAKEEGLRITHVTETHIHADFLSGTRELATRTGSRIYLSDEGAPDWRYRFAERDGAVLLTDGDSFEIGNVRLDVMHTPGHTPEHLTFLVTDQAGADRPMGAFTGDFLFVGDVGRPDLLEKAAKVRGTMEAGARDLYRSLQRFKQLDDWLQIWPGHGAGSACGKELGAVPTSTLGYERRFNWAFSVQSEDAFVTAVLEGQPEPPAYFAEMKRLNRDGPRIIGKVRHAEEVEDVDGIVRDRGFVIDTRSASRYALGHLPGSISIPLDRQFTTNAGSLVPYDEDLRLVVDDWPRARTAERHLRMIGLDRLSGLILGSTLDAWTSAGGRLETSERIGPLELAAALKKSAVEIIDVRGRDEWDAGHIAEAVHVSLGDVRERCHELEKDRPLVTYCASGSRSAIAASILRAEGFSDVKDLEGGLAGWFQAGGSATGRDLSVPNSGSRTPAGV